MDNKNFTQHWKRIINTMNDGLMIIGPNGKILAVNKAFEDMTGYSADEAIGNPCTMIGCDACEKTLQNDGDAWCALFSGEQGDLKRCRCMIIKKDGTWMPALKNASVLREVKDPLGVVETITDLSDLDELEGKVEALSRKAIAVEGFHGIIGESFHMRQAFNLIQKAAQSDAPVIIYGESGTGKELVAQAIHDLGPRHEAAFVQFSCAALNDALIESELFGHVKGAFTGAHQHRKGRFEAAHGGDIFLDEIGDIPLAIQVKLLRILEKKELQRVGNHHSISVDVRIISATHRNLEMLIKKNLFREDLFFRVNTIPIHIPPLRERPEDIPLLVESFIRKINAKTGKALAGLKPDTMEKLIQYHWPGNVRELKSALEYAVVVTDQAWIELAHLPPRIMGAQAGQPIVVATHDHGASTEKALLIDTLRKSGGNQSEAARRLGVSRVTVWNRINRWGIDLNKLNPDVA